MTRITLPAGLTICSAADRSSGCRETETKMRRKLLADAYREERCKGGGQRPRPLFQIQSPPKNVLLPQFSCSSHRPTFAAAALPSSSSLSSMRI